MTYQEFLDYIFKRYSGNVKLGLERITGVLQDMGNPQNALRGIHIGGTNGKGSACAACEALLLEHGQLTGLNTSPHLIDYCERFRVNGKDVAFKEILDIFHRFKDTFAKWDASFFEITTAIAFQLFADMGIESAVIEVGLGGRLDATKLFVPEVTAITTIGLDHVKTLGDTPGKIAFEKAGIIKQDVPLVLGMIEALPLRVILDQAQDKTSEVYIYNRDFTTSKIDNNSQGIGFDYKFGDYFLANLWANLLGRHQAANIAVGLTAFLIYCQKTGIKPEEQKIRTALRKIHWKGRMQLLRTEPTVIVDGAHNLQGVETLTGNLKEFFPVRKLLLVVSILADKDYKTMLQSLCPFAKTFYISKNESDRAAEIEEQAEVVRSMGIPYKTSPTVKEAYQLALTDAGKEDIIIGAGSLYTVAEILSARS